MLVDSLEMLFFNSLLGYVAEYSALFSESDSLWVKAHLHGKEMEFYMYGQKWICLTLPENLQHA